MHYLPGALFGSKDSRNPKSEWGGVLPCAKLGYDPLYLHNVGKLGVATASG